MGDSTVKNTDNAITGVVEDSNINLLQNIEAYFQYIRETIKQIIIDDDLKYSDPMDKKKIYPDFTYTQFLYLLSRIYDRVYSVNLELLCKPCIYNNYNKPYYDTLKVKKAYEVYYRLCQYYGYVCTAEPFYTMTGLSENIVREWLSSGYCDLYNTMLKNAKNTVVSRFENSRVPLLQLAAANYKYNLNQHETMHEGAPVLEVLPDLLALPEAEKPHMIEEK